MIRFTKIPHSVRLLLTNRCNLDCCFCLSSASSNTDKNELTTEEWLAFFERLKELKIFNIGLSGGEIFLRSELFVLLKKLRENRMHRITLLSNGTLISKETAGWLGGLNIKNISISLDGLAGKHDQIRGSGAFAKTVNGIRCLIDVGIKPCVSFTPVKSNYKDLGPLIDFIAALGVSLFRVNTLSPEGRCREIYKDFVLAHPGQIKEVLDVVEEKKKKYPGFNISCELGFYYHLPESYKHYLENPKNYRVKHLKDGCGAASTSCTITASGDVVPCEGLLDFAGGNIRERDLADIWNESENLKTIRNLAKISMAQTPYCKECKYIYLCDGGCRATAYLAYKDLKAPSVTCPYSETGKLVTRPTNGKNRKGE